MCRGDEFLAALDPQDPQPGGSQQIKGADHRPENGDEHSHRHDEPAEGLFGIDDREVLRHELAEHGVQERDEREREDE